MEHSTSSHTAGAHFGKNVVMTQTEYNKLHEIVRREDRPGPLYICTINTPARPKNVIWTLTAEPWDANLKAGRIPPGLRPQAKRWRRKLQFWTGRCSTKMITNLHILKCAHLRTRLKN